MYITFLYHKNKKTTQNIIHMQLQFIYKTLLTICSVCNAIL